VFVCVEGSLLRVPGESHGAIVATPSLGGAVLGEKVVQPGGVEPPPNLQEVRLTRSRP
jgi:hypothetical protein